MARIDGLLLGGLPTTSDGQEAYGAAVAYRLKAPCQISRSEIIDDWAVESAFGGSTIVARSRQDLDRSEVITAGTEAIQRHLDLLSFETCGTSELSRLGDGHVVLYSSHGRRIIEIMATDDLVAGVSASGAVQGKPPVASPPAVWTPALRYYRRSQASVDVFEAYRNLWLGLEALLSAVSLKGKSESERGWLRRVFGEVSAKINWRGHLPDIDQDLSQYMLKEQYERMRCYLFHAKPDDAEESPLLPDPAELATAYAQLIRIWREIAHHLIGVRRGGIGVITYEGFRHLMSNALSTGLTVVYSDARQPAATDDTVINPNGSARVELMNVAYSDGPMPGIVSVSGKMQLGSGRTLPEVWRFGCEIDDPKKLFCAGAIAGGLTLDGVDQLDILQRIRLKNASSPRVSF